MKIMKSLTVFLVLVVLAASWMPVRVATSQTAGPDAGVSPKDSLSIEYVGHTGGDINHVTLQGNYAYINEGQSLTILDISVPGTVAVAGRSPIFSSWVGEIALSGNHAYIANGDYGLRVMWLPNPTSLFEWSRFDTPGSVHDVALAGDYAYIADWTDTTGGGLRVVNVTVPEFPYQAGFLETDMAEAVTLSGSYAYVVRSMYRPMLIVDISDPSNPVEVGSYDPSAMSTAVAVVGDFAYLATFGSGLRVLDVSNPANPTEIGILNSSGSAVDITVQGSYAYLAEANSPMGLRIVDVSDPTNPTQVGYYAAPAWAFGVAVSDSYAYVASSTSGLRVVDVSQPSNPTETDYYEVPNWTEGVSVVGDQAYLASPSDDLAIVDIYTSTLPLQTGLFDTETAIRDIAVQGNYVYLGTSDLSPGLHVVDVSDPINPIEVGYYATSNSSSGVSVTGNYAYLVGSDLRVINISDPTNPVEAGYLAINGNDVSVFGNYAYLARYPFNGIRVVDISDPTHPFDVGELGAYSYSAPVVAGNYAYVAELGAGLSIVNVTNPISPTEVGFHDTPGNAVSVAVEGSYAYVADGESGVRMIDVSEPTNPVEVGYFDTPDYASSVSVASGLIYVADQMSGMLVLQYVAPPITTTTTILSDDPDPSLASQPFTVAFAVTSTLGIPTGVVTVTVSQGEETCSGELVDGEGSCQVALARTGTHTLTATYAGDGSFQPSSASEQHTVKMRRVHLPLLLQNQFLCSDFFDDFSDPNSGWYTGEDSEGQVAYLNGEYLVLVKPESYYWLLGAPVCAQVNYTVEADARWTGNSGASYGLIFGIQGDYEQFYSFEVNSDYQEFALFRYDSAGWTEIAPITYSSAILGGKQTNHLKATRNGNAIILDVNGSVLGTWFDGTITGPSYTGLIVSSYSDLEDAEARFDNYSVTGLGSTSGAATASFASDLGDTQAQISTYRQSLKARGWR